MYVQKEKECEGHCPKCDSRNIKYGGHEFNGSAVFFEGECKDCGCEFEECYGVEYGVTQYEEDDDLDPNNK